jgi:hypothetical protein
MCRIVHNAALTDVVNGQVQVMFESFSGLVEQVKELPPGLPD